MAARAGAHEQVGVNCWHFKFCICQCICMTVNNMLLERAGCYQELLLSPTAGSLAVCIQLCWLATP
jgi:hypothetical protein